MALDINMVRLQYAVIYDNQSSVAHSYQLFVHKQSSPYNRYKWMFQYFLARLGGHSAWGYAVLRSRWTCHWCQVERFEGGKLVVSTTGWVRASAGMNERSPRVQILQKWEKSTPSNSLNAIIATLELNKRIETVIGNDRPIMPLPWAKANER